MSTYTVAFKKHREIANRTLAFHFEKPAGFTFKPGQAIDITLPAANPAAGGDALLHTFSLVNAPFQDEIVIATRMRDSAFKRALGQLAAGTTVKLEGPAGSLTLSGKSTRPAVFLAGGIGITPFHSMLQQAAHDQSPRHLTLLYSNSSPENAAFLEELEQLARRNPNFHLMATMTHMQGATRPWHGETGMIDAAKIKQVCAGLTDPIFYLAGPPAMVESLSSELEDAGIDEDDVRSEEFFGY
ncbi:MAG: FAD-dependent oxidoreductase [Candidimonas sp.]|nr:MAG: FAD-dependent oxidoreductase [Candidimonas sp.]